MLKQEAGIKYASSHILDTLGFVRHGFLSRTGGISKPPFSSLNFDTRDGDNIKNVEHNKTTAGRLFGFEVNRLLTINQVHGDDVLIVDTPVKDISNLSGTNADAIITNQRNLAIGILTADCVPILLSDPVKKIVGIAHAGWRGTVKRIVQKTIEIMINHFDSDKKTILAAIGPSIGQCCYTVNKVVAKEFGDKECINHDNDYWRLDLKKANLNQMLKSGILEKNISVEDICTSCRNDLFFSYRADNKKTGRQLNFIIMQES